MATLQDYLGITKLRDAWPKWKANIIAINNQVINHVAGTADKHAAQDITYTGGFAGKTEVKEALDQAKTEIDLIVVNASIDPEVAFARESLVKSKTFGTLDARLEESEQDRVTYTAETTTHLLDLSLNVKDFGALGDYNTTTLVGTDNLQAFNDAISACSGGKVLLPSGNFKMSAMWDIVGKSNIELVGQKDTTITFTMPTSDTGIKIRGTGTTATVSVVTVAVQEGDNVVTVADTAGFAVGDIVLVSDTTVLWDFDNRGTAYTAEYHRITAINAGTKVITLDCGLFDDYGVTTQIVKCDMIENIKVTNIKIVLPSGRDYSGLVIENALDVEIDGIQVKNGGLSSIGLGSVLWFDACNCKIDDAFLTGYGYGIQTNGCQFGTIHHNKFRGFRRAIDISGIFPSRFIEVHDNYAIAEQVLEGGCYGTHGCAEHVQFNHNTGIGAICGIHTRGGEIDCNGNKFYNLVSYGFRITSGKNVRIKNNKLGSRQAWPTANKKPTTMFASIETNDFSVDGTLIIEGNDALIADRFIYLLNNFTVSTLFAKNNIVKSDVPSVGPYFIHADTGAIFNRVISSGNEYDRYYMGFLGNVHGYIVQPPTGGNWLLGDRVPNEKPTAGGYDGWACVTRGTPGVWKGYGLIQA